MEGRRRRWRWPRLRLRRHRKRRRRRRRFREPLVPMCPCLLGCQPRALLRQHLFNFQGERVQLVGRRPKRGSRRCLTRCRTCAHQPVDVERLAVDQGLDNLCGNTLCAQGLPEPFFINTAHSFAVPFAMCHTLALWRWMRGRVEDLIATNGPWSRIPWSAHFHSFLSP